jgi:tricorn protease
MSRSFPAAAFFFALLLPLLVSSSPSPADQPGPQGYYRYPAIGGGFIVFTAEGDLWRVPIEGGLARRLTTHHGWEYRPVVSPDGTQVAFTAQYEGTSDVYVMPLAGGLPRRLTWENEQSYVASWIDNKILLYATSHFSTLPSYQLVRLNLTTGERVPVPLAQAADGVHGDAEELFFVRLPHQGSHARNYPGGTVQNLWKFTPDMADAVRLHPDFEGTSRSPMWWQGRVYFATDRDRTINLWSMLPDGTDLRQHTFHEGWDVKSPALSDGMIVYQLGADLYLYEIATDQTAMVEITLASDFDQMREKWIDKPMDYLTSAHLSGDGSHVVLTARGQVFVRPVKAGRMREVTRNDGVRYRSARFLHGNDTLIALSDESGEVEFWQLLADGTGVPLQLTDNAEVLRFDGLPSPDGNLIAYTDKNNRLWVYERDRDRHRLVDSGRYGAAHDPTWAPDSRHLAWVGEAENDFSRIWIYAVVDDERFAVTSDHYESYDPAFSPDGKWLYFISQRNLDAIAGNVWGPRAEQPFLYAPAKLYQLALSKDARSPFELKDELTLKTEATAKTDKDDKKDQKPAVVVSIDRDSLPWRLYELPVDGGNYTDLNVTDKAVYYRSWPAVGSRKYTLNVLEISDDSPKPAEFASNISEYELSGDLSKILLRSGDNLYVVDASVSPPASLDKGRLDLTSWTFPLNPREEWRQMFLEAWRLERDYFYDTGMHGVDWTAIRDKYLPLVDRVTDRWELSDLLAHMISELSALHMTVGGGDHRTAEEKVTIASLGALLIRDVRGGGYRVDHIYRGDPERPETLSPLAKPGVGITEGDMLVGINGQDVLKASHINELIRNRVGQQVLVEYKPHNRSGTEKAIVVPVSGAAERNLRYLDWEITRRRMVDSLSDGQIGYVHIRAMGRGNYAEWARDFFPVWNRPGLIIDVRHNQGGNIDSWIIGSLLRKPFLWWQPRIGQADPNFQYGFAGHMVTLCNEWTSSDGEMFVEGFRRLQLGKVIGTRTWGGGIWLSYANRLVDNGIASAAEFGVFGPEGSWPIEWYGVEPDSTVDNLPHETFNGRDRQLETAIEHLMDKIRTDPIERPIGPEYPDRTRPDQQ